ncbi:alpha-amylase family glycosyl hydrolase [Opitutus sp. ER46]|uniref:alpha-amylase family glycosyl hydrolase n=1 Tax=Opitutus sp. ER46 TaxID=2161864 RepID=UPI000D2FFBAC|nr:alpha-amylase family glycosyl hydrolase [Opitutus sp. ER46]PTX91007.1 alpha-amylase [Opitutus sp. ER46]
MRSLRSPWRASFRALLACAGAGLVSGLSSLSATPAPDDPPVGWWREATFYEIFVRSFADARTGPLAGDGIGDLQGAIERLDHLNDGRGAAGTSLGVNAVWLMPIHPSPSYHGYDVTDYFAVNPQYGDIALMKRFVAEAHRRGIRVIIDFVLNHSSSAHPWFVAALADGTLPGGQKARELFRFAPLPEQLAGPWGQWVWYPAGRDFYYAVFSPDMPDWNFRHPAVTAHHRRAAAFWLRDVGVDGLRLDAVRYFCETGDALQDTEETRQWLREFTAYCHQVKPDAFVIGENTADMREVTRNLRGGSLDSAFEFDLAKATIQAVRLETPGILQQALTQLGQLYGNDAPWATILTNHDQERAITQLGGDLARTRLATAVLFTLPGVPFVYYGEELGLRGAKPDPELRTPMPWTPESPHAGFTPAGVAPWHPLTAAIATENVATQEADPHSMLALYRRLVRLNANSPALRHGQPVAVTGNDRSVYATLRQTPAEVVLVIANFTARPRPGPQLSAVVSCIQVGWTATELLQGAAVAAVQTNAQGGFAQYAPLAELAPLTLYVVRWRAP